MAEGPYNDSIVARMMAAQQGPVSIDTTLRGARETSLANALQERSPWGTAVETMRNVFQPVDEMLAPQVREMFSGLPQSTVTPLDLGPLDPTVREGFRQQASAAFGQKGEYLYETPSLMRQTPEGMARMFATQELVSLDKRYAPRLARLKEQFKDAPEKLWDVAIPEYKASVAGDVGYSGTTATGNLAIEAGLWFAPEARVAGKALKAGAPLRKVFPAAVFSGSPLALGRPALSIAGSLGKASVIYPAKAATAIMKVIPGPVGRTVVKAEQSMLKALHSHQAKTVERIGNAMRDNVKKQLGSSMIPIERVAMEAGVTDLGFDTFSKMLSLAGLGYLADGDEGMAASLIVGGGGLGIAKLIGRVPLPMVSRELGQYIGSSPVWGAMATGAAGSAADFLFGDDDDLSEGIAGGMVLGAFLGPMAKAATFKRAPLGIFAHAMADTSGDLNELGKAFMHTLPQATLSAIGERALIQGNRILGSAALASTDIDPKWLKNLETAKGLVDVKSALPAVNAGSLKKRVRGVTKFMEAVETLNMQTELLEIGVAKDYRKLQPILEKLTPEDGPALTRAMRMIGADGQAVAGKERELERIYELNPAVRTAVRPVRQFMNEVFQRMKDSGYAKETDFVDAYFPHVLDRAAFYKPFKEHPDLLRPRSAWSLQKKLLGLFKDDGALGGQVPESLQMSLGRTPNKKLTWKGLFRKNDGKLFFETLLDSEEGAKGSTRWMNVHGGEDFMTAEELNLLRVVRKAANEYKVHPATVLEILSSSQRHRDKATSLFGAQIKTPELPKSLKAGNLLKDTGSNLPFLDDPILALELYISRMARKQHLEPLVKSYKAAGAIDSTDPNAVADALLGKYEDVFKEFPGYGKIMKKLTLSRMGYPSETEILIDEMVQSFFPHAPGTAREASRLLRDLQYTGALGFAPAKALRNSFQSLLTATALDGTWVSDGIIDLNRNRAYWVKKAQDAGALRDLSQDLRYIGSQESAKDLSMFESDIARKAAKKVRGMANLSLSMFQDADSRNRQIAFVSAYRKMRVHLAEGKPMDLSSLRMPQRKIIQELITDGEDPDKIASVTGKYYADLTQWVYGKTGAPLLNQGMVGGQMMMFTSWPLNYVSLLKHWAGSGDTTKVINLALGAALLDRWGYEQAGVTRLTGLTTAGDQNQMSSFSWPSGALPSPSVGGPLGGVVSGTMGLIYGAVKQDPRMIKKSAADTRWDLTTSMGIVALADRVHRAATRETPGAAAQLIGFTPRREPKQ